MTNRTRIQKSIYIKPEYWELIEKLATNYNLSTSDIINLIIKAYDTNKLDLMGRFNIDERERD